MNKKRINFPKLTKKRVLLGLAIIIVVCGLLFVLEKRGVINLRSEDTPSEAEAQTTSTAPTAQSDFTGGDDRQPANTESENRGSGEVADNNGVIGSGVNTANPVVSNTGQITLFSPRKNSTISSGQTVAGKSSLPTVSYRLIDSVSGVIASGELKVVNGSFSGTLNFTTTATEGRLDIFAAHLDGVEYSNIEVPLVLK